MSDKEARSPADDGSHGAPSGPPRTPAGVADNLFAVNIRERREAMDWSQADLARKMAEGGWPWYPQTVHRVETGARKVSVGEAKALAETFGTTVDRLTWPGREASAASMLMTHTVRAEQAQRQIAEWTAVLLHAQRQLRQTVTQVEEDDYLGSAHVRRLAEAAREAMKLSAEEAVAEGMHPVEPEFDDEEDEGAVMPAAAREEGPGNGPHA